MKRDQGKIITLLETCGSFLTSVEVQACRVEWRGPIMVVPSSRLNDNIHKSALSSIAGEVTPGRREVHQVEGTGACVLIHIHVLGWNLSNKTTSTIRCAIRGNLLVRINDLARSVATLWASHDDFAESTTGYLHLPVMYDAGWYKTGWDDVRRKSNHISVVVIAGPITATLTL